MIFDYLKESINNIRRNKKNKTLIIIFTLLFVLLFIDIIFYKNFKEFINLSTNKNVGFRTFTVYKEKITFNSAVAELKNIEEIVEVFPSSYYSYGIETDIRTNNLDGEIDLLYGTKNITPKSILGKQIEELQTGEIICPYDFYPDTSAYSLKIDSSKIIKPDESLNYEFNAFYLNVKIIDDKPIPDKERAIKKFKIVGLYDNKLVMNQNNQCYITPQDMKTLQSSLNPHLNYETSNDVFVYVVIDNAKNLDKVQEELKKIGYNLSQDTLMSIDKKSINLIITLSMTFLIVVIFTIILIQFSYINKKLENESQYLGILKACGYNKKQIILKQFVDVITTLTIIFIISITIFNILFILTINSSFNSFKYIGFEMSNSNYLLIIAFFITTSMILFMCYFMINKKINNSADYLLKE